MLHYNLKILELIINKQDKKAKSFIRSLDFQDSVDNCGNPFLHFSVYGKNKNMVRYLVSKGYNVNAIVSEDTPLMLAVNSNNEEIVKILLNAGADIYVENVRAESALRLALRASHVSYSIVQLIVKDLCKKCGTQKKAAEKLTFESCHLYHAALLKDTWIIDYMLKKGVPINTAHGVDERTALHVATALDDIESVRLLLEHGANVQTVDHKEATVLHYVYKFNMEHNSAKLEMLEIFLKRGLLPTSFTKEGAFQISPTLVNGSSKAIRVLLQSQIDCTAKDLLNGRTLLHYLATNTNSGLAGALKRHIKKFNINALDLYETTPLYQATAAGNVKMVQFLLEQGAQVHCVHSISKFTPLHQVFTGTKPGFEDQYNKCAILLLQYNADPQCIAYQKDKLITIFDVASKKKKIKPVIAQLALLENQGTTLSEITRFKINLQPSLKKYLKRCKRMLGKKIAGSITVSNLLNGSRRRIAQYLSKVQYFQKSINIKYKRKLKKKYSYYYVSIEKRLSRGFQFIVKRNIIDRTISQLLQGCVNSSNIIIDKIVDFLDDESLQSVYQLGSSYGFLK